MSEPCCTVADQCRLYSRQSVFASSYGKPPQTVVRIPSKLPAVFCNGGAGCWGSQTELTDSSSFGVGPPGYKGISISVGPPPSDHTRSAFPNSSNGINPGAEYSRSLSKELPIEIGTPDLEHVCSATSRAVHSSDIGNSCYDFVDTDAHTGSRQVTWLESCFGAGPPFAAIADSSREELASTVSMFVIDMPATYRR